MFGRKYTLEHADENNIHIDYTYEGNGTVPIPNDLLFTIRQMLSNRKEQLQNHNVLLKG